MRVPIAVEAVCEACGHPYSSATNLYTARRWRGLAEARALEKKMARLQNDDYRDLPPLPCPECGYTQSWNVTAVRKVWARKASDASWTVYAIGLFFRAMLYGFDDSALGWFFLASGVVAALVYGIARLALKLYDPNQHVMPATRTLTPTIVPPEDWPWRQ